MAGFSKAEWKKINQAGPLENFGLPERRPKSVIIGTFNIRKLGTVKSRSPEAWSFLAKICERFDLLAVQEVMVSLEGLRYLQEVMGLEYNIVISDFSGGILPSGVIKDRRVNTYRLAFLFNWKRIHHMGFASNISYVPMDIATNIFKKQARISETWEKHHRNIGKWEEKYKQAKAGGKRRPKKPPPIELPMFHTFNLLPHCASFEVVPKAGAMPFRFLAVNAHLLFSANPDELSWEFSTLFEWLTDHARNATKMEIPNILLLGDCNLSFERLNWTRQAFNATLKNLNIGTLKSKNAAKVNFPLLTPHPVHGELHTNARNTQTNDQIGIFAYDEHWPLSDANDTAGQISPDSFDYGVFNFRDFFAQSLYGKNFNELTKSQFDKLIKQCENDVSDHMPAWFRLPIPGTS